MPGREIPSTLFIGEDLAWSPEQMVKEEVEREAGNRFKTI